MAWSVKGTIMRQFWRSRSLTVEKLLEILSTKERKISHSLVIEVIDKLKEEGVLVSCEGTDELKVSPEFHRCSNCAFPAIGCVCDKCGEKIRSRQKKIRERAILNGMCGDCKKVKPDEGYKTCSECRKKMQARRQKERQRDRKVIVKYFTRRNSS